MCWSFPILSVAFSLREWNSKKDQELLKDLLPYLKYDIPGLHNLMEQRIDSWDLLGERQSLNKERDISDKFEKYQHGEYVTAFDNLLKRLPQELFFRLLLRFYGTNWGHYDYLNPLGHSIRCQYGAQKIPAQNLEAVLDHLIDEIVAEGPSSLEESIRTQKIPRPRGDKYTSYSELDEVCKALEKQNKGKIYPGAIFCRRLLKNPCLEQLANLYNPGQAGSRMARWQYLASAGQEKKRKR